MVMEWEGSEEKGSPSKGEWVAIHCEVTEVAGLDPVQRVPQRMWEGMSLKSIQGWLEGPEIFTLMFGVWVPPRTIRPTPTPKPHFRKRKKMEKLTISPELLPVRSLSLYMVYIALVELHVLDCLLIHKCILHIIKSTLQHALRKTFFFFWHKIMATTENLEKYKHFKKEVKYSSFQLPEMPPHDILVYFVLSFFYACIYTFPWSIYSSAFYVFMFCFFTYIIKHFKNHDFFYVCTRFHCKFTPIFIHPIWCYFQCFDYYKQHSDAFLTSVFKFLSLWSQKIIFWRWIWVFSWLQVGTAVLTAHKAWPTQRLWTWLRTCGQPPVLVGESLPQPSSFIFFLLSLVKCFFLELSYLIY